MSSASIFDWHCGLLSPWLCRQGDVDGSTGGKDSGLILLANVEAACGK